MLILAMVVWLNTWKQWLALNKARNVVELFEQKYVAYSEENGRLKRELSSLKDPGSLETFYKRNTNWRGPNDFNLVIPTKDGQKDENITIKGVSRVAEWWKLFEVGGYGKMAR